MAMAADRIENIHDDGTSTKLSEATATSKESDPTSENGEKLWKKWWNVNEWRWKKSGHEKWKMQIKVIQTMARGFHCVQQQQSKLI